MAARTLTLAALAIAAVLHVATAQVTDGCAGGSASATAANGFFTLNGACFGVIIGDFSVSGGVDTTCDTACSAGGLLCESKSARTAADCTAVQDAYIASDAAPADMPASVL